MSRKGCFRGWRGESNLQPSHVFCNNGQFFFLAELRNRPAARCHGSSVCLFPPGFQRRNALPFPGNSAARCRSRCRRSSASRCPGISAPQCPGSSASQSRVSSAGKPILLTVQHGAEAGAAGPVPAGAMEQCSTVLHSAQAAVSVSPASAVQVSLYCSQCSTVQKQVPQVQCQQVPREQGSTVPSRQCR